MLFLNIFLEMEVWRASAEGLNTVIVNPGLIIGSGIGKKAAEPFYGIEKMIILFWRNFLRGCSRCGSNFH